MTDPYRDELGAALERIEHPTRKDSLRRSVVAVRFDWFQWMMLVLIFLSCVAIAYLFA